MKVKAITLYQPWASLIMAGAKRFETRSWCTEYRGLLVIHAGKTLEVDTGNRQFMTHLAAANIGDWRKLPLGAALGVVNLVGCWRARSVIPHVSAQELAFGFFDGEDRKAWELRNPVAFAQPVPMRGQQGLWEYTLPLPDDVLALFPDPV